MTGPSTVFSLLMLISYFLRAVFRAGLNAISRKAAPEAERKEEHEPIAVQGAWPPKTAANRSQSCPAVVQDKNIGILLGAERMSRRNVNSPPLLVADNAVDASIAPAAVIDDPVNPWKTQPVQYSGPLHRILVRCRLTREPPLAKPSAAFTARARRGSTLSPVSRETYIASGMAARNQPLERGSRRARLRNMFRKRPINRERVRGWFVKCCFGLADSEMGSATGAQD